MQKLVFNHVSILTAMIPYPAITGHARPLIARLELPMCFQPDGGISDSFYAVVLNVVTFPLRGGGPTVSPWEIVVTLFSVV